MAFLHKVVTELYSNLSPLLAFPAFPLIPKLFQPLSFSVQDMFELFVIPQSPDSIYRD